MFDLVCIHELQLMFRQLEQRNDPGIDRLRAEIQFLVDQGVVFEAPEISPKDLKVRYDKRDMTISYPGMPSIIIHTKKLPDKEETDMDAFLHAVKKSRMQFQDFMTRLVSSELRQDFGMNSAAVISGPLNSSQRSGSPRSDVLTVMVHSLPEPDDSVPWERILEFRNDPDSRSKALALNNWMIEIARADLTPLELSQKIEFLIHEYQQHLTLHKMKTRVGALETVLVATAEFLEDFAKFRWGKIAKDLFTIKHQRVALFEAELKSPGRELAYILKARKLFSPER